MSEQKKKSSKRVTAKASDKIVASATVRHVRIPPRKARMVLEMIRGKQVEPALQMLMFSPQKGALVIRKLLESAIANAREGAGADVDRLWITGGFINQGRVLKRYMPAAHGRANPIRKRSSHITVQLGER